MTAGIPLLAACGMLQTGLAHEGLPQQLAVATPAHYLTIVVTGPLGTTRRVTRLPVTDRAQIARIESALEDLPPFPPGTFNCPNDNGSNMQLVFRATASSPVLEEVTASESGCGVVAVVVGGASEPARSGGIGFASQVLAIVHAAGAPAS